MCVLPPFGLDCVALCVFEKMIELLGGVGRCCGEYIDVVLDCILMCV